MLPRYVRMWLALARFSLARELAFRGNFLVKISVEIMWLAILLVFYDTVFSKTDVVADWTQTQYLFFVGCSFALNGLIETLFLENCQGYAELIRTGDLDFYLLKPIDEQFLVSCRTVDWSCIANVFMGAGVMLYALRDLGWPGFGTTLLFLVLMACGLMIAFSFLVMLMALSVWFMRNQSLMEMWWLFTTLMRYPREIFRGTLATPVGMFFTFVAPIMLVTNIPAGVMVQKITDPLWIGYMLLATLAVLGTSRWIFRYSLARYRSASS